MYRAQFLVFRNGWAKNDPARAATVRKTSTCCQTLLDTRESERTGRLIDAQTVGKASVRVCALSGTQVGPPRDASQLKARRCKLGSSQSCVFAFQCRAGGCGQGEGA